MSVEPRQAASLILLRDGPEGAEVLLVQRNPEQRFMGGAWVFPGGAVHDGEDTDHAATAIRELEEEAGIDLGEHPLPLRMGHRVTLEARRRGALVRPLGDTVVLMPPLSIAPAELGRLVEITGAAITAAAEAPLAAAA